MGFSIDRRGFMKICVMNSPGLIAIKVSKRVTEWVSKYSVSEVSGIRLIRFTQLAMF